LRPVVLIRIGTFFSARIGHFSMDAGLRLAEKKKQQWNTIDLYWLEEPISNKQWAKMVSRNFHTFSWVAHLARWNRLIPGGNVHYRPSSDTSSRDIYGSLEDANCKFEFLLQEVNECKVWLKSHGWKDGDRFVCLQVRDSSYLGSEKWHSKYDWDYHSYRNSDIETYIPVINWLIDQNIWVFRMGKSVNKRANIKRKKFIDYPFCIDKNDLLDVWLFANCDLCISTATGPDFISDVYRRPILLINYLPLIDIFSWSNVMGRPKNLIWASSKKPLTLNEHLKYRFGNTNEYKEFDIEIIDLSPDEILDTVKECWGRINGTYIDTEGDIDNQKVFWKKLLSHENSKGYHCFVHKEARISNVFLKNNKYFFR